MENFGERLRKIRKDAGLTQVQVAERCGISQSNVNTWESGKSLPLPDGIMRLADCFGCSVDYLLGRENEESIIVINEDKRYTQEEKNLIELYRKLSNKKKDTVMEFIKFQLS